MISGFKGLARRPEEHIMLHLARPIVRMPPVFGRKRPGFWLNWQAFIPGQSIPFATGVALSPTGAESKAWKAYDHHLRTRGRWFEDDPPYSDNALRVDWPRR